MAKSFWTILAAIFGGLVAFATINAFLVSLGNMQRWDYILANALIIILVYFTYLTYELQQIKEKINADDNPAKK